MKFIGTVLIVSSTSYPMPEGAITKVPPKLHNQMHAARDEISYKQNPNLVYYDEDNVCLIWLQKGVTGVFPKVEVVQKSRSIIGYICGKPGSR